MPKKVEYMAPKQEQEHVKKYGGFNDYPPNFQDIREEQFWNKFSSYNPNFIEFRQFKNEHVLESAHLFIYSDGNGIGYYEQPTTPSGAPTKFFSFGLCVHDWLIVDRDGCLKVYQCQNCTARKEVDSSD